MKPRRISMPRSLRLRSDRIPHSALGRSGCFDKKTEYVPVSMDWQEVAALGIVGCTAVLLLWSKFRKRRFSFQRDTHCGCSSPSSSAPSIVVEGRRGEPPRISVKNQ
jgi:hypothetical protein